MKEEIVTKEDIDSFNKLKEENKALQREIKWIEIRSGIESFFYTYIKWISLISVLILVLLLDKLGGYTTHPEILVQDLRSIIGGILVGIIFSFLLSLKSIRTFLLKSVSHFMSDDSYIDRLDITEVKRIRDKIINRIHGTDIVTNKESLFNHFKKLDVFLSTPHKSIVDEKWIFEEVNGRTDIFKLTRIQDYRIHTLDHSNHSSFDLIFKSYTYVDPTKLQEVKDNLKLIIKIDSETSITIDKDSVGLTMDYNNDTTEFKIDFTYPLILKKEYTQIHIEIEKYDTIDNSHAVYSSHATYHLDYSIQLPTNYKITNVYHSNTLDLSDEQVNIKQTNDNNLSVNINGWQLPGLIFVYTFTKK